MKNKNFEEVKDSIKKVTSPIDATMKHFSSVGVGFDLEEELRVGLLYTLIFRAAIASNFLVVNEKKETEEKNNFFVALDYELQKKSNSGLTLDELFNEGVIQENEDGNIVLKIKEDSRLYRIIQAIQAKPYEGSIKLTKTFPVSNSKVIKDLASNGTELIDKGQIEYIVSGKGAKKVVKEYLTIISTEDSVANFFSESHAMVYDTIGAIYDQFIEDNPQGGGCFIPLARIHQGVTRGSRKCSEEAEKQTEEYINDMRNSPDITFDYSQSADMHRLPNGSYVVNRTKILNAQIVTLKYKGNLIKCVHVFDRPFLWTHAVNTKKVFYLKNEDYNILDNGKPMLMTETRLCALRYLSRRIEQLKTAYTLAREKIQSYNRRRRMYPELNLPEKKLEDFIEGGYNTVRKISMDSLFKACKVDVVNSKTELRTFVKKVFAHWKNIGKITDFIEEKKGHSSLDAIIVQIYPEIATKEGEKV